MGSVLWPMLSVLIWIAAGWLVCTRAVEGERRFAGVRLRRGRPRLLWGVLGSLFGGAAVAAFLFAGHALVFSEGIPDSGSPQPPSFSSDFSVFCGTLAVALLLAFLRLRWLRPSVVWALTATLSAFRLLPPLFREGETEVLVFSTLLLVEAVLLLVYPRGAARPYVFRNSRGGAVTAFVAEGVLALPLVIPAAWLSLAPSAGSPGESPWFLWPAVLPWVLQVRTARGPIGPELLVRAGMAAGGALVSPVILLFPAEETRAVAMLVLASLLVGGEEVRERAAARAVTSPWQEGEEATIVAVVDGSPAAELGIRPGMRLVGVNGTPVRGPQDAYAALQGRPAYVKLELKDADGEILYRERGRYEGDLPLLGIVFAPRRFDPRRSAPPPEHGIALLRGFPSVRRAEAASGETPEVSPAPAPPPAQPPSGGIISEEWRG